MSFFSNAIRFSGQLGLYRLASLITRNQPRALVYHRFSNETLSGYCTGHNFELQLRYIKKHYRALTMTQLVEEYYAGGLRKPNTIAITIDDGYDDFYKIAYPLLKKYQLPATLYVATGFIENKLWLWPDQVSFILNRAVQPRPVFSFENVIDIQPELSGYKAWSYLIAKLLSVSDPVKHEIIQKLASAWHVDLPALAPDDFRPCTEKQLVEMSENNIEIGGHSVTHPSMGQVDDDQALFEIDESKRYLINLLGDTNRSFCYPNGTEHDYTPVVKKMVQVAGYSCAVTAFADSQGFAHRYAIRRHASGDDMFQFYKAVSGVEYLGYVVRKDNRKIESEC
jgi:peptidoglycan/xylan/chitin deacetylase (PgdA/CDA1 family)